MRLRWTSPALCDLEALGDYIARDDPATANRVVARIFDQTDRLAEHPHIGRPGRVPGTRELVIADTPYIVPYRVRDGEVELLAVFHGARGGGRRNSSDGWGLWRETRYAAAFW